MKSVFFRMVAVSLMCSSCLLYSQGDCNILDVQVFLEGPLQSEALGEYGDMMSPTLNEYGYLPGQEPVTLLGSYTGSGQPFYSSPWSYLGEEGLSFDERSNVEAMDYPEEAIDWVLVTLRSSPNIESIECSAAALLLADGSLFFTEGAQCCDLLQDEYYIAVEHRNHLPVMTPTPVSLINGSVHFDFRQNQSYMGLLGSGQKEVLPGVFAMYAGNGDQQSSVESPKDINFSDFNVWAKENGRHSGYYYQDYDLNGDVNVIDKVLWLKNIGIFTDVER